jgi:UDP-N-acetyl-D-mannosaminuronic acid dehydrogenase
MGYVGSSLSAIFAEHGVMVRGVDIDERILDYVADGECPIEEAEITERFETYADEGRITATDSYDVLDDCEIIIVTVGTPLSAADPDLSAVEMATRSIGPHVDAGNLVVFRSTLPAGATEDTIRPILDETARLTAGKDYSLAFCPERMAEGNAYEDMTTLPVVVGGLTETCRREADAFWQALGHDTVTVSSPRAAELAKLADNWWIDLNIALANEIALLSEAVGVDALEVIHAANTLPKGDHNVNILFPGAGVGGSCLVKDPWFVANLGDEHGLDLETPRVSRRVNDRMPAHVVNLTERGLHGVDDGTIAVLGYAFKSETDDTRNTPAKAVVDSLVEAGHDVRITDPYVSAGRIRAGTGIDPVRLPEALDGADAVVIITGHGEYRGLPPAQLIDYVGTEVFAVIDGRHVFGPDAFAGTDVRHLGVGRGSNE